MSDAAPAPAPAPGHPPAAALRARRVVWPELDLLRGLAGLAMVVNHTAVGLVPAAAAALIATPAQPLSMTPVQWASFLGSFAPMLFFFITGVGYGLQARPGGVPRKPGLWGKVAVLVLADALLWRSHGLWIGLDFFGFIAGSMLLLGMLNRLDRKLALGVVVALLGAVTALRYGGGAIASALPGGAGWLDAATGRRAVAGVSFPPMPWLGYPLVGWCVGAAATAATASAGSAGFVDRRRGLVAGGLLAAAAACIAAAALLVGRGYPLHRWSTLSASSYAAGFGVLAVLLAACLVAFPSPRASAEAEPADRGRNRPEPPTVRGFRRVLAPLLSPLCLRGVAAFAVVPLHFLLIAVLGSLGAETVTASGVLLACGIVAVFALGLAPAVAGVAGRIRAGGRTAAAWWIGLAIAAAAFILLCAPGWEAPARTILSSLGQLALCLLLALPLPWAAGRTDRLPQAAPALNR